MPFRFLLLVLGCVLAVGEAAAETRCGWLDTPPGKGVMLLDGEGKWIIAAPGEHASDATMYDMHITPDQFVRVAPDHGLMCACLDVEADRRTHRITRVHAGRQLPLKRCLEDPDVAGQTPL